MAAKELKMTVRALTLLLLLLCGSLAMAQTPTSTANSGIAGVILISPTRGGPIRVGVPSSAPLRQTEFVVRRGGETVATFKTDENGTFHVPLPPGRYTVLRANWNRRVGRYGPFAAEVSAGEVARVQWVCDSGMR